MNYYDIHTHRPSINTEDVAIISVDIRKPFVPCGLWYSMGVHPWYIDFNNKEMTDQRFEKVREYSLFPSVVAIGETGLDKMTVKTTSDFLFQQKLFTAHACLAEEVKKPLIIHCVRAYDDLLHIRQSVQPSMPWIVHGFRGKASLASRLINAGLYLSFGQRYNKASLHVAWDNHRLFAETDDSQINIQNVYQLITNDLNISLDRLSNEIAERFKFINR